MLVLKDIGLKETRFYQEVFAEGQQFGVKEGEQKGIKEGIKTGIKTGQVKTLIMLLESRFGKLTAEQKKIIKQFNEKDFERIFKNIWQCDSLQSVFDNEEK